MVNQITPVERIEKSGTPSPVVNAFNHFLPLKAKKTADGSIKIEGMLNKSFGATVCYDAESDQILVSIRHFMKPATPARPMTKEEMQALEYSLRRYMKETPGRQPIHEAMNRRLRAAIAESGNVAGDVVLTEADNGKMISVAKGQKLVVNLPANPSTGYGWQVIKSDRSLGLPQQEYIPSDPMAIGSGGTARLTWNTVNPFLVPGGSHQVTLAYKRPWENTIAQLFSFTVKISGPCRE